MPGDAESLDLVFLEKPGLNDLEAAREFSFRRRVVAGDDKHLLDPGLTRKTREEVV
jgi:hypothetical protein